MEDTLLHFRATTSSTLTPTLNQKRRSGGYGNTARILILDLRCGSRSKTLNSCVGFYLISDHIAAYGTPYPYSPTDLVKWAEAFPASALDVGKGLYALYMIPGRM